MDWFLKAILTATTVSVVMCAARRSGQSLAGVVAALPTITAPTLAWLVHEQGVAFAVDAAVGSISACAMLAIFALGYAFAARYTSIVVASACGLIGALAMALPAFAASSSLAQALTLSLACSTVALASIPVRGVPSRAPRRRSGRTLACVAATTGTLAAVAATIGPALGSFATGLLSSLPLISGAVVMVEHATGGQRAAQHFLRGYVWGLFGKAAFGAVFALLALRIGATLAMALACGCALGMSMIRLRPLAFEAASPSAHADERRD